MATYKNRLQRACTQLAKSQKGNMTVNIHLNI